MSLFNRLRNGDGDLPWQSVQWPLVLPVSFAPPLGALGSGQGPGALAVAAGVGFLLAAAFALAVWAAEA